MTKPTSADQRAEIDSLTMKLAEAEQMIEALRNGEIDAVARRDSSTPVLLHAAQEKLRASEMLLRAVFDGAMDAILISDDDGRYVDANPAACILFGLEKEQLLGRTIVELAEPLSSKAWTFPTEDRMEGQLRVTRPDGERRDADFRTSASILPGLHLSILRDMSDRRRAEQRFRAMVERSHDGLSLVDATGLTIYTSPAIEHILGVLPLELEGKSHFVIVHPDDMAQLEASFGLVLASPGMPMNVEFRALHRDGSPRWLEATATNLIGDPAVNAIIANFRDVSERRLANSLLGESRRMLDDAQKIAHLGTWMSGATPQDPVTWSTECAAIFGLDHGSPPSAQALFERTHPDDRQAIIAASQRTAAHEPWESEHRIVLATGEVRWVHARTSIEGAIHWTGETVSGGTDEKGKDYRVVGVIQDITERKRAQDELRASELRYRRIVDNTSEGVWMYDAKGTTTFVNPRMAAMLGCTVDEVMGQPIFSFIDASQQLDAQERLERRRKGTSERGEFRLTRRDGSDLWVQLHADALLDVAGNFENALALVTDITERRRADETRNRLASIVESSDDAIISRGVDGLIRTWNRSAERLTQYTAHEAVGRSIDILYAPEELARLTRERGRVDDGKRLEQFEMIAVRKDGSRVDVSITSSLLIDDDGAVQGASIIARDISERRKADGALRRSEEQLRQAQKMEAIGSLAGGIAHDFNNLLSVILSYTTLIVEDLPPMDPMRADLIEVQKAGLRASELTRQLLAFSRQQVLQPVVLDVNQVVLGVEKMLKRLLREDIELTLLTSSVAAKVHADLGQLEQVLMNLVVNARDAMPNGGKISIETSTLVFDQSYAAEHPGVSAGPYVMLAVTDTGTGMDAATKQRIFEPFFTTKEVGKGTGLGLSTVYGIVQQSGGHIWVYSESGLGTTFKIFLPQTQRRVESHAPPIAKIAVPCTETILLVEDEDQVRAIMRAILRKEGYTVLEAQNGGEAFLQCEQFTAEIHLLLTDVVMPRMSGRQLAERLSKIRPAMKVLYVSGYTDDTVLHHGVLESGVAFLQKPIMPAALIRKVRDVLDG